MNGLSISLGVFALVLMAFALGYAIGHYQGATETWDKLKGYKPPAVRRNR